MNNNQFTLISTMALVRREVFRVVRLWKQTIFPSVISTVLYFSIFGVILGARVGTIDGVDYISFVSPGLVMLALVTNSYTNTAFCVLIDKFHRSFEELLSSPMSDHQIIVGFIMGGVFRGMVCGLVVWLTAYLFVGYLMLYPISFVFSSLLTAVCFSLMGFLNGLFAKTFDDLTVTTTFLLNPLIMLGGVFYSVTMLSPTWQMVAWINPLLYVGNLFRFCMIGVSNIEPIWVCSVLLALSVVMYGLIRWIMARTTYVRQ